MKSKELIRTIRKNFNPEDIIKELDKAFTKNHPVDTDEYQSFFCDDKGSLMRGTVVDYDDGVITVDFEYLEKWPIKLKDLSLDELLLLALVVIK